LNTLKLLKSKRKGTYDLAGAAGASQMKIKEIELSIP